MYQFIETLRLFNGKFRNFALHKGRIARTLRHHYGTTELKNLDAALYSYIKKRSD